jgi:FtsZ-binding cell division protein ZapB
MTDKTDITLLRLELDDLRSENTRLRDEIVKLLKLLEGDSRITEEEIREWMG